MTAGSIYNQLVCLLILYVYYIHRHGLDDQTVENYVSPALSTQAQIKPHSKDQIALFEHWSVKRDKVLGVPRAQVNFFFV